MPRKPTIRNNAAPERLTVGLEIEELGPARDDGQMEIKAVAQFFNRVNDRLMVFREGSFQKTIEENVRAGKVKINDGHRHSMSTALGTVTKAWEENRGVVYEGLISSSRQDEQTLLREGHIQENSIEFFSMTEGTTKVDLGDVPTGTYIWNQTAVDGKIEAREILEVSWVGIALLPFSSQGVNAVLEANCAVPFQDHRLSSSESWDAAGALERVMDWAGTVRVDGAKDIPNFAKLSRCFLARGPINDGEPELAGLIVDIDEHGRPFVVEEALAAAVDECLGTSWINPATHIEIGRTIERYAGASSSVTLSSLDDSDDDAVESPAAEDPAGPTPSDDGGSESPTDDVCDDEEPVDLAHEMHELEVLSLRVDRRLMEARHPEAIRNDPAEPGEEPA